MIDIYENFGEGTLIGDGNIILVGGAAIQDEFDEPKNKQTDL